MYLITHIPYINSIISIKGVIYVCMYINIMLMYHLGRRENRVITIVQRQAKSIVFKLGY